MYLITLNNDGIQEHILGSIFEYQSHLGSPNLITAVYVRQEDIDNIYVEHVDRR
jgi:hypothetical protein